MFKNVYVPIDNSDISDKVLKKVAELARDYPEVKIKISHVVHLEQVAYGIGFVGAVDLKEALVKIANNLLEHAKSVLATTGVKAEFSLLESYTDDVAELVYQDAQSFGADLLVLGSHRLGGLSHFIVGGVIEDLAEISNIPLLLITDHKTK